MDFVIIGPTKVWTCPRCKLAHEVTDHDELDGGSFVVEGGSYIRCVCGYRKLWHPAADRLLDVLDRRN